MEDLKAKIIELERDLELERQSKQLLQEGYDILSDLYVKLSQDCNRIKDEIRNGFVNLIGQSADDDNESSMLDLVVLFMKESADFKIKLNNELDELRKQTLDAIEGYNSKVRRLNDMLKRITEEKLIGEISAIFAEENKNNEKNNN
jgi:hypothetical protein